jgi:Carboxypeptidase regulatory-like domain/TonB dependent receptor/TonB-dependent Receptor Plug Domain
MSLRILTLGLLLLSFVIGFNAEVLAQAGSTTASITGAVRDEQGAVIGGATVVAKDVRTNFVRETTSDEEGNYVITQVPPGTYELAVQASGFNSGMSRVEATVGSTLLLNFSLRVGASNDVVEVTANVALDQGKTESSTTNDRGRIDNLPINRRNFLDFSLTSPRVTPDRTPQQGVAASSGISFNGLPARLNNITIDGLDNNDLGPGAVRSTFSQEAVQEFQVVSDSYSAEFGRSIGGVINIVTRGGGNDLRGNLFFLNRNDTISSRNTFSPINPEFKQYQFGATLSGPIKKDKAFFFTAFERLSIKQNSIVTIPDSVVASARRQGFLFDNGPIPFGVGTTTFLARTDLKLSANDTLFVRYNFGGTFNGAGEPFGDLITGSQVANTNSGLQNLQDNNVAVNNTYINAGLNLVNETRFLYARRKQDIDPVDATGPQVNIVTPNGSIVFGRGTLLPQPRRINIVQFVNNTSLVRGRHQIKFGGDYYLFDAPVIDVPVFEGAFGFFSTIPLPGVDALSGLQSFDPTLRTPGQRQVLTALGSGVGLPQLANLPIPIAFSQGFSPDVGTGSSTRSFSISNFLQDDIKVTNNFLLKLGVRYDLTRTRFVNKTNGNVAPRVSFAYRPSFLPKLNIRGGYGIFFASALAGPSTVAGSSQAKRLQIIVLPFPNSIIPFSLTPGRKFPASDTIPPGVMAAPQLSLEFSNQPNQKASYTQQLNFGFDYLIANDTVLSVNYGSVRGLKVLSQRNINPITNPIPGDPINSAIFGRPDPTRGDVFEFASVYDSYYNALTVSLNRRVSKNIGFIANYTFAKTIDNFIDIRNELQQSVNPLDPGGERGLSLQDVRSRFVASGTWDLNYTRNPFLRDFSLSGIVNLESGRAFNLLAGQDLNLNGDNPPGDRPLVGGVPIARNLGLSPGFASVDMRLSRAITINEHVKFQAFIEAFNLFNRVNISDVNPIFLQDPVTGRFNLPDKDGNRFKATPDRFRAAFAPRQFQFGFRMNF